MRLIDFLTVVALAFLGNSTLAAPKLLPFQGHLVDADGQSVGDGAKVVQFKIYDAPVSGTAVWAGEVHKLSVNGGLVNTILGTKAAFPLRYAGDAKLMFSEPLYLEITIDAQGGGADGFGVINAADPPLLPRQVLLPANFAHQATNAENAEHAKLATTADLALDAQKVQGQTLLNNDGALMPGFIAEGSITKDQLATGAVTNNELASSSVTIDKLAGRRGSIRSATAGVGEVAFGDSSGFHQSATTLPIDPENPENPKLIGTSGITLATTGRPVRIQLIPANNSGAYVSYNGGIGTGQGVLRLSRDGQGIPVVQYQARLVPQGTAKSVSVLPGSVSFIDFPPAGNVVYFLQTFNAGIGTTGTTVVNECRLIAYEL